MASYVCRGSGCGWQAAGLTRARDEGVGRERGGGPNVLVCIRADLLSVISIEMTWSKTQVKC
jgi:hypothetical protein